MLKRSISTVLINCYFYTHFSVRVSNKALSIEEMFTRKDSIVLSSDRGFISKMWKKIVRYFFFQSPCLTLSNIKLGKGGTTRSRKICTQIIQLMTKDKQKSRIKWNYTLLNIQRLV